MKLHNTPLGIRFLLSIILPLLLVIWFIKYSLLIMEDMWEKQYVIEKNYIITEHFRRIQFLFTQLSLQQRQYLWTNQTALLNEYQRISLKLDETIQQIIVANIGDEKITQDIEMVRIYIHNWKKLALKEINQRKKIPEKVITINDVVRFVEKGQGKLFMDDLQVALDNLLEKVKEYKQDLLRYWIIAIAKDIADMEAGLKGYLLIGEDKYLESYNNAQITFRNNLSNLRSLLKGDYEDETYELDVLLSSWIKNIAEKQIEYRKKINKKVLTLQYLATQVKNNMYQNIFSSLNENIQNILIKYTNQRKEIIDQLASNKETIKQDIILLGSLIIIFSLLLLWISIRSVIQPIRKLVYITKEVANGNLSIRTHISSQDEIGQLSRQLDKMLAELEENRKKVEVEQQEREAAVQKLQNILVEREEYNWLKTQLASITQLSQGIKETKVLAQKIIALIAKQVEAAQGVFYMINIAENKEPSYSLLGSYAYTHRKHINNKIMPGEGLVGQCIVEKENIILTQVPNDYVVISSGLGEAKPLMIMVLPILFEGQVVGVIELSTFTVFTDLQQHLLNEITQNMGVIINSILNQEKTAVLLLESQQLTLESQMKTEELQVQTEELQYQSKCLKQANQELQEKTTVLEQQKEEIEESKKIIQIKVQELEQTSRYKSEFLANMSHELRTPLNSLLILSKILSDNEEGNLTPEQVHSAKVIYEGGQDLLNLINDILDLSKIEAHKLQLSIENVALDTILNNIERMCRPLAENKHLDFRIEKIPPLHEYLKTDAKRVEQILRNLLANAVKFTHTGAVTLSVKMDQNKQCIGFIVSDTGIGIAKDKYQIIFEAFQQSDGSISRSFGGTGLGLTISKVLTELLQGRIELSSEENVGSTFILWLPLQEESPTAMTIEENTPIDKEINIETDKQDAHQGTLLIYETNPKLVSLLMEISQQKGYQCVRVDHPEDIQNIAKRCHPDAIIMSKANKEEIFKQLPKENMLQSIPLHLIDEEILQHNMINYLTKPVNTDAVVQLLHKIEQQIDNNIKKILVVEDDRNSQQAIIEIIKSQGEYHITTVENAEKAYTHISQEHYDCIIVDLSLPDMNGDQLLEQLYSENKHLPPVIVYTAKDLDIDEYNSLQQYASSIVIKGDNSYQRLLDELSLFLVDLENKDSTSYVSEQAKKDRLFINKKILLVDDDIRNTFALSGVLARYGLDVEVAENGQKALDKLQEDTAVHYDLILMDIMMPVMDGYETIQHIRTLPEGKNIPIIALTAKAMKGDDKKCIDVGANDYLTKPIDMDKLLSILYVWLAK